MNAAVVNLQPSSYVDGRWQGPSGVPLPVMNPATGRPLATLATATAEDVHRALAVAGKAQRGWAALPAVRRGDLLRAMADVLVAHRGLLAGTLVDEVGKPLAQAGAEVDFAVDFLRYNAGWDRKLEGQILAGDSPGEVVNLLRAPVGVVAAICPWNFPLAVFFRKVAPALVTGNAVVAKPSEVAPLTILLAVRLIDEALELPAGVLNVVTGGPETGVALVESELTAMVSFTGHRDTGKRVMATAARNLTRVSLELGGKAPAIVLRDADLDLAVKAIVAARHTNCGQVCTSAERVFVHEDVVEEFTHRYVAAVDALVVGDPSAGADVGPMVSAAQLAKTREIVDSTVESGAVIVSSRDRANPATGEFAAGYWFPPTVLRGVTADMRVMTDETFGPVTPILAVSSLDEALALANDSRYGLSAYVFSRDYGSVMRAVNELEVGEIYVNRTLGESVHAHHAGVKESGIGGEDGRWGILEYTHVKTVYHRYG
jgi:lactaldehyde dehydrogenase / glycolaldehyde dehydrogenase